MIQKILLSILLILLFISASHARDLKAVNSEKEMIFGGLFDIHLTHYKGPESAEFEVGDLELSVHAKLRKHVHLIAKGNFGKEEAGLGEDVHILFNFLNFAPTHLKNPVINLRLGRFIPPFAHEGFRSRRRLTIQPTEMTEFLALDPDDGAEIRLDYDLFHADFSITNGISGTHGDKLDYVSRAGVMLPNTLIDFFMYTAVRHQEKTDEDIDTRRYGGVLEYYDSYYRLQTEVIWGDGALNEIEYSTAGERIFTPTCKSLKSMGYYVLSGYKFFPSLELIAKYSYWDYDIDTDVNQERHRFSGTLIWEITENSYIKTEGILNWEDPDPYENDCFAMQLLVDF